MKNDNQDYVYTYDNDRREVIMINGETGERVQEEDDEVTTLLKFIHKEADDRLLRMFSVWCTRQINANLKPIQKKILDLAENAIAQDADAHSLQELYRETEGTAVAADTVGLRRGSESAPAYLAARECINPDALAGAIQAARFHRLWAELQDSEEKQALREIRPAPHKQSIEKTIQQQIDFLLDLMNR